MKKYSKYINTFSVPSTVKRKELENMHFGYAISHFIIIVLLMYFPVMYTLATISPYDLCSRMNIEQSNTVLTGLLNERNLNIDSLQNTDVISQYFVEINNRLVESGLYQQVLNFVLLGSLFLLFVVFIIFFLMISIAYQYTRNLNSKFKYMEILKLAIFSSTIPAVVCLFAGFLVSTIHLFLFQIIVTLWLNKFLAALDREEKEEVKKLSH